jgi:hypothetical protein
MFLFRCLTLVAEQPIFWGRFDGFRAGVPDPPHEQHTVAGLGESFSDFIFWFQHVSQCLKWFIDRSFGNFGIWHGLPAACWHSSRLGCLGLMLIASAVGIWVILSHSESLWVDLSWHWVILNHMESIVWLVCSSMHPATMLDIEHCWTKIPTSYVLFALVTGSWGSQYETLLIHIAFDLLRPRLFWQEQDEHSVLPLRFSCHTGLGIILFISQRQFSLLTSSNLRFGSLWNGSEMQHLIHLWSEFCATDCWSRFWRRLRIILSFWWHEELWIIFWRIWTKWKHVSAGTISIHNGILTVSTQVYTDFWADSRLRKAWVLAVRHLTTPHSISQLRQLSGQLWQPDDLDIGPCRQGAGWAKLKSKLDMKLDMTWLHRLFMIVYDSWNFDCTWDMQFRSSIETSELYEVYV